VVPASLMSYWHRGICGSTLHGITLGTQVAVADIGTALAIDFGFAVGTLIVVTDVAATLTIHFRLATCPEVVVADIGAALAVDFGFAVGALIVVTDVVAIGICIATQHQ